MKIEILKGVSKTIAKGIVKEIMAVVESVFPDDMKEDYRDPPYFQKQLMNPDNICIVCRNADDELTGVLIAMLQNEAWKELSKYDLDFEKDPENSTYYVEVLMSDSKRNHESNRSSFKMINELIREVDRRGKRYITMHALRNEGLSLVVMRLYPAELIRTQTLPELYGPDEVFDYLRSDIYKIKWLNKQVAA